MILLGRLRWTDTLLGSRAAEPDGHFRRATADDHAIATEWTTSFASEVGEVILDVAATVEAG